MIKLPSVQKSKDWSYNEWLEFFRTVKAADLIDSQEEMKMKLPMEAFAAYKRWLEIIENPSKMDKILQGRLEAKRQDNIMEVAVGDDDEMFYEQLIRENVAQLNSSSTSPQEVARLSQNINIFRRELREIRSRKPRKGTTLERVLEEAALPRMHKKQQARSRSATAPVQSKDTKERIK